MNNLNIFFFKITKRVFLKFIYLISFEHDTKYFGTPYGGWDFVDSESLYESEVISAGIGEDVSFDILLIDRHKTRTIFIDPTPRAIVHMEDIHSLLGNKNKVDFDMSTGKQNPKAYDLRNVKMKNIRMIEKALSDKTDEKVQFYLPKNPEHVSHSISNYQNNFIKDENYIEVVTTSIPTIVEQFKIKDIELIKLDIEGAEIEVLKDMLNSKIFPNQILVEFDELTVNFIKPYFKASHVILKLLFNGYVLISTDNFPNFLFVKKDFIKSRAE